MRGVACGFQKFGAKNPIKGHPKSRTPGAIRHGKIRYKTAKSRINPVQRANVSRAAIQNTHNRLDSIHIKTPTTPKMVSTVATPTPGVPEGRWERRYSTKTSEG